MLLLSKKHSRCVDLLDQGNAISDLLIFSEAPFPPWKTWVETTWSGHPSRGILFELEILQRLKVG